MQGSGASPGPRWPAVIFACCDFCRYVDETVDLCQLLTIVRYLGRKHGLAGKTEGQQAAVEEVTNLFCLQKDAPKSPRGRTGMCAYLVALGRV